VKSPRSWASRWARRFGNIGRR